jgi:hypothetical protein
VKNYYLEGCGRWFIVRTTTKKEARSEGVEEFGHGQVTLVREATPEEVKAYTAQRPLGPDLSPVEPKNPEKERKIAPASKKPVKRAKNRPSVPTEESPIKRKTGKPTLAEMKNSVGPCPICQRPPQELWLSNVPLTAYCWGTDEKPHPEARRIVPDELQPYGPSGKKSTQWIISARTKQSKLSPKSRK